MPSERERFVYIVLPGRTDFVTAGLFRWTDTEGGSVGEFVYGASYRERRDAVEIDPVELRLSDGEYRTARQHGFFGAIRDAMPDDWGRRTLEARVGRGPLEEFDYLEHGANDRIGALGFGPTPAPPAPVDRFNRASQLEELQEAADRIVAGRPPVGGDAALEASQILLIGTSMGGARPKAQVLHDGKLWIAKFGRHDDRWNDPRVEHGMLQLARACGLTVAESRVEPFGERDVLLVRRFDRELTAAGLQRHRMASALTLLRADERDRERWSYLSLADEVRRATASPRADLKELFARMCFNAAASNLDDHPRNHAIVASGRRWRLSPAYDLTPSPVVGLERDLAMTAGAFGRRANRDNLVSGHGRFMLEREEAATVFEHVSQTVQSRWDEHMRKAGVSGRDRATIAAAFGHAGLRYENVTET